MVVMSCESGNTSAERGKSAHLLDDFERPGGKRHMEIFA